MVGYTRHKRAVAWPQGFLLLGLRAALGFRDLNHMTVTGRCRGLKIVLDAGTEVQKRLLAGQRRSVCVQVLWTRMQGWRYCVCDCLCVHERVKIHLEGSRIRLGKRVSVAGIYKRRNRGGHSLWERGKNSKAKGDKIKTVRLLLIWSCGLHRMTRKGKVRGEGWGSTEVGSAKW